MPAIGGPIVQLTVAGRIFAVVGDNEIQRHLGGDENDFQMNGDGETGRLLKTIMPWKLADLQVQSDDAEGDQEFLQDRADSSETSVVTVTFASGVTYQGTGHPIGEISVSNQSASGSLTLSGAGKLTAQ